MFSVARDVWKNKLSENNKAVAINISATKKEAKAKELWTLKLCFIAM
jgi:hypothetical protein